MLREEILKPEPAFSRMPTAPTSSRAKHAGALTNQPALGQRNSARPQYGTLLTSVPPAATTATRSRVIQPANRPQHESASVQGRVVLLSAQQATALLQGAGTGGHGPGNRVRAARSLVGIPYKQETSPALRTGSTAEALAYMDCSEFTSRVLALDGLTQGVMAMDTRALKTFLSQADKFVHAKDQPQAGDVALWDGHVGIVSEVGKGNTIRLVHASGKGKLSGENKYAISPAKYRSGTFYGYYRPINEAQRGTAGSPTTTPFARPAKSAGDYRSGPGGSFPLREIVVRPSPGQYLPGPADWPQPIAPKVIVPSPQPFPANLP